jgi:hypothetical protein
MKQGAPLAYRWTGDGFEVLTRHQKAADREFVVGEIYRLEQVHERSAKSHAQFFASLNEGWLNLPEAIAESFPSAEHLRKHCLIKSGFFDKRSIQCSSKAEALRLAAFIKPIDEYAIVTVTGSLVTVYTAQSQSYRAMGKDTFQQSKQAVLDLIADMIGVEAKELNKADAT